jgi:CRISPR-associated protein Csm5
MEDKNITLPLRLKVITPLHVGDDKGKMLSPYCDYVFSDDGQYLHYLNLSEVEKAVINKNALEEYVSLIQSMDNNRSEMDLKRFLSGKLGLNIEQVTWRRIAQKGLRHSDKLQIIPTVKNAGMPYLPGSSLKGALRTAILYDWLVYTEAGKEVIEKYREPIKKAVQEHRNRSKQSARPGATPSILESVFKEEELFGKLTSEEKAPEAQHIRVRDSRPVGVEQLTVYALRRIRIAPGQGKSAIPQVVEAIQPGTQVFTELSIRPVFHNSYFEYMKTENFADIFNNLSNFSKDCISNEIEELEYALDSDKKLHFKDEIENLLEFYENLKERTEKGAIFFRLGFGKTINDNSLILALLYGLDEEDAWYNFREVVHNVKGDRLFPVTRSITPDGKPMGWVEVMPQ